jgi:hypothetical protein
MMTELTCTLQPGLEQEQEQEEQEHREGGRGGRGGREEEEKYDEGELEEVDLALSPHSQRSRRVGSGSKFASDNFLGILHDYERQELERRTGLAMAQKEEVESHSHSCPSQQRDCSLDHATACCLGVACYVAGLGVIALCIYFMIVIFSVIAK